MRLKETVLKLQIEALAEERSELFGTL